MSPIQRAVVRHALAEENSVFLDSERTVVSVKKPCFSGIVAL
jgi:hypothetical protein